MARILSLAAAFCILVNALAQMDDCLRTVLTDREFYPEGVARDASGTLYIGSTVGKGIMKAGMGECEFSLFTNISTNVVTGMIVDDEAGILYACNSLGANPGEIDFAAVSAFDLGTGEELWNFGHEDWGFCNDIALDNNGNLYITDSFNPFLFTYTQGAENVTKNVYQELFLVDDTFNSNGIAFDGEAYIYIASAAGNGSFARILIEDEEDATLGDIEVLGDVATIDGLKYLGNDKFAAVSGAAKLLEITLNKDDSLEVTTVYEANEGSCTTLFADDDQTVYLLEGYLFSLFAGEPAPVNPAVVAITL